MATGGARIAWGFTRFLLGLILWCVAGLFVFVLLDGAMPVWAAITVASIVMLGLPTLLTRLLIPAFERLGEKPRWIELWPGLCAVVALLALVGVPLFGRAYSARKLGEISTRHQGLAPWAKRASSALSRWLAPGPAVTGNGSLAHRDGGTDADAARVDSAGPSDGALAADTGAPEADDASLDDASDEDTSAQDAVVPVDADDLDASDAAPSQDVAVAMDDAVALVGEDDDAGDEPEPDAALVEGPPIDPRNAATGLREFARLQLCDWPRAVWMGELALGGTDELVVSCDERVHVLFLQNDGVVERAVFVPRAPSGMRLMMPRALVADIDGDGRRDLGICGYFTSDRGGTRGGGVWWARGRSNGQFEAPRVLVSGGVDCGGIEFGDVNGDARPELLIVKEGNGYAATGRESELLWYAGAGTQWTQRGRVRLSRGAFGLWLEDVTRDGILDAIVHTGWDGERRNWVIAGARRGPSGVVNVEDVGDQPREFLQAQGRLDGDAQTDVVRIEQQRLLLWRTGGDGREVRTSASRALDFERFEF